MANVAPGRPMHEARLIEGLTPVPRPAPRRRRHTPLPALSVHAWLRFDAVSRLLGSVPGIETVLEVGAGQGATGALLARSYRYLGVEPDPQAFERARARLGAAGQGQVLRTRVEDLAPGLSFDLVCALEVLEHLEDDVAALTEWRRRVRPGGWLLVSVPAGPHRFGAADRRAGHLRRYGRDELTERVERAGFADVVVRAYGFPVGYALEHARNLVASRQRGLGTPSEQTATSGRWLQPPDGAARLTRMAAAPFRVLQRPFEATALGTGFVLRARRL